MGCHVCVNHNFLNLCSLLILVESGLAHSLNSPEQSSRLPPETVHCRWINSYSPLQHPHPPSGQGCSHIVFCCGRVLRMRSLNLNQHLHFELLERIHSLRRWYKVHLQRFDPDLRSCSPLRWCGQAHPSVFIVFTCSDF